MSGEKDCLQNGDDIHWEDTTEFIFPLTGGRVIKVYDGDTITVVAKLPIINSPLYRLQVRLNGIDTPEIKGSSLEEKEAAILAKELVSNLLINKFVTLKNIKTEKYGRLLADVYLGESCINDYLIEERYAVKYDGKTKINPKSWLNYRIKGEY